MLGTSHRLKNSCLDFFGTQYPRSASYANSRSRQGPDSTRLTLILTYCRFFFQGLNLRVQTHSLFGQIGTLSGLSKNLLRLSSRDSPRFRFPGKPIQLCAQFEITSASTTSCPSSKTTCNFNEISRYPIALVK